MNQTNAEPDRMEVLAEVERQAARVQLVRLHHPGPSDFMFRRDDVYWVDLCVTPRRPTATARYAEHWGPHRFVGTGALIALPPGQLLHLRNAGGRHTSLLCQLKAEAVGQWLPDDFVWSDRRLEACLEISNATIRGLLLRMAEELRRPTTGAVELIDAILVQLSIEIARYLIGVGEPTEKGGLAAWRVRVIDKRLREAGAAPTLGELAALCNMSVRHLTRAFRTSRGCSIGDYMVHARVEAAKRRLASDESIKTIALSMGFCSAASFAHSFRRAAGVAPNEYRKRVLRGGDQRLEGR